MKKKSVWNKVKSISVRDIILGEYILFSALAALFGFSILSISNTLVLILYLVKVGMGKDLKELCDVLLEEFESEY